MRPSTVSIATMVGILLLMLAGRVDATTRRATIVRQIGPSVSGAPGQNVEIRAALTALPGERLRLRTALAGVLHLSYKAGDEWVRVGSSNATGCYGDSDPYALAKFTFRVPPKAPKGARIDLRFNFQGNPSFLASMGEGSVLVR